MDANELEIIQKAQSGDEEAYTKLYQMYFNYAFYYAWKLCRNEADARDIAQDAFFEVSQNISRLRSPEYFKLWLSKIVLSKCTKSFHKNRTLFYDPDLLDESKHHETRPDFMPHDSLSNQTDKEIIHDLMEQLTDKQREILQYYYFDQLAIKDIAVLLHISENTVKSRMRSARNALENIVKEYEKMEGRKLDFRLNTGSILLGTILAKLHLSWLTKSQKALNAVNMVSVVSVAGTISLAAYETYDTYQGIKAAQEPAPIIQRAPAVEPVKIKYQQTIYEDREIASNKEAYYVLIGWARDKDEMTNKTKEEFTKIKPTVDELKNSNCAYKTRMENNLWFQDFEIAYANTK